MEAGGHGHGDRRRTPAHHARRSHERCGHEDDAGIVDGQALYRRGCSQVRQRVRADPRRLWVHKRLPGGKVLSRREALHYRRRHQRDPAAGDRPAVAEGLTHSMTFTAKAAKIAKDENELSRSILDAAFRVHSALGPGLLEGAYEACLAYELRAEGFSILTQVPWPLFIKRKCSPTSNSVENVWASS